VDVNSYIKKNTELGLQLEKTTTELENSKTTVLMLDRKTKCLNETICQIKGNIRVMVRVRPLLVTSEREPGFDHIAYGIDEEGKDVIKITNLKGKETHTTVDKVLKPDVQ